ncbi:MAG: beta-lactamase family protein [Magnetococcales bacterium]|nr:beta-lactamase family protein [Magnetococcales bacterium]
MEKIRFDRWVGILAVVAGAGFLGACGGGSNGGDGTGPKILTGIFSDAPVNGLTYVSSPSGYSGTTANGGQFQYLPLDTVTFKVNGMGIGTATAAAVVTPIDLVTDPLSETDSTSQKTNKVIKILQLLQTLDTDKTPANGITVKNDGSLAQKTLATLDFTSATDLALMGVTAADVVSQQNAADHFLKQMDAIGKSGKAFYFARLLKRINLSVNGSTPDSIIATRWAARQSAVVAAIQKSLDALTVNSTNSSKHGTLPGAVVKVTLPDGTPKAFVSGYYDMGSDTTLITGDEKAMVDTKYFRVGSITKTFITMTVLQLVQEGKIGLTDPLSTYFTAGELDPLGLLTGTVTETDIRGVTVQQLLTHMSGIPQTSSQSMTDKLGRNDFSSWGLQGYLNSNLDGKYSAVIGSSTTSSFGVTRSVTAPWQSQDLLNVSWNIGPSKPGSAWAYSNINYILLGMIIEKKTGNAWYTEVANRFGPNSTLGLGIGFDTSTVTGAVPSRYVSPAVQTTVPGGVANGATGYIDWYDNFSGACQTYPNCLVSTKYPVTIHPSFYGAAGALTGSVHDLYGWATAIGKTYEGSSSGALLTSTFQSTLNTALSTALNLSGATWTDMFQLIPNVLHMGLGIFANVGHRMVGHPGQVQGYDCSVWYRYDVQQPVASCANTTISGGGKIQDLVVNSINDLIDGRTEVSN